MEINVLGDDKYQVIHDGRVDVMSLLEVCLLLSTPIKEEEKKNVQEEVEEFWNSLPAYPRM